MKYVFFIGFGLFLLGCNEKKSKIVDANDIINQSIKVSGVNKLKNSIIEFDFRDIHYIAGRSEGKFELQRVIKDSVGIIHDYLANMGFQRYVNDSLVTVADSMATKYSASVNSVHYFAVLPYGLDAKAVNKSYLEEVTIKVKKYHKIKVTFDEEGGGEDFEDEFIYWINSLTDKVDYLAYSYKEEDGIGLRFRESINERYVNDVRIVDYNNYKPKDNTVELTELDQLFIENKLELLSKIELKNVTVN